MTRVSHFNQIIDCDEHLNSKIVYFFQNNMRFSHLIITISCIQRNMNDYTKATNALDAEKRFSDCTLKWRLQEEFALCFAKLAVNLSLPRASQKVAKILQLYISKSIISKKVSHDEKGRMVFGSFLEKKLPPVIYNKSNQTKNKSIIIIIIKEDFQFKKFANSRFLKLC